MNIIGTLSQEHIDSLLAAGNVASINLARRPIAKERFTGSLPDIEALYLRGLYSKDFYVWNTSWVDLYTEAVLQGRSVIEMRLFIKHNLFGGLAGEIFT